MRRAWCAFKAWERRRAIARSLEQAYREVAHYLNAGEYESALARVTWWHELLTRRHGAWWVQDARDLEPRRPAVMLRGFW